MLLDEPGVARLLLMMGILRCAVAMEPLLVTLHIVLDQKHGFAAAGLAMALMGVGNAIGAPVWGHLAHGAGLRVVLGITVTASVGYWVVVGVSPYGVVAAASLPAGALAVPAFSLARQCLAAMLPAAKRQTGMAADSMSVEVSYAVGPPLGILIMSSLGWWTAFGAVTTLLLLGGVTLYLANPPTAHHESFDEDAAAPDQRSVTANMLVSFGATFTLLGTESALTARMREFHTVSALSLLIAVWCVSSLVGGFVYGSRRRVVNDWMLLILLASLVAPLGLGGQWTTLAVFIIPSGLCCAPLISANAESLMRSSPASRRGWLLGLQSSAFTLGGGAGAVVSGLITDQSSPAVAFLGLGLIGIGLACAARLIADRGRPGVVPADGIVSRI